MSQEINRIPIIKLWQLLLIPIQGHVTDEQLEQLAHDTLDKIHESAAMGVIIDITGMWIIDSHICSLLSRLSSAARLMGAATMICGMSPEIAMTLQSMGLEMPGVSTRLTLEEALEHLGVTANHATAGDPAS